MDNVFEHIMQDKNIKFKHSKGMRDIFGREFHQFHEIFFFVNGDAEFISERRINKLSPNTLIIIPQNTFHHFNVNGSEADYTRYVFNFYDIEALQPIISQTMTSTLILSDISKNLTQAFEMIAEKSKSQHSDYEKKLILQTALSLVLLEIKELLPQAQTFQSNLTPITDFCVRYINKNIHQKITIDDIAAEANYSKSSITHNFKKDKPCAEAAFGRCGKRQGTRGN